ncbi:MAG: MFS transporter [Nitrospirae bacterium]|nr:MFS transporter [Nitrospirota bacterium]
MSAEKVISKRATLIVVIIASFLTPFMGSSVNIALPSIGNEFKMDAVLLSWVPTSFILAAVAFLIPFGRVADIYGRKKIFAIGITVFTFSAFFIGISTSATELILFRVFQGLGSAMVFGTGIAILTSVFPANERGKALGLNVASVYLGLSLGPFLGGLFTQYFGWRSIFFLNIPIGLFIIVLILFKLQEEWSEARGEKFDYAGSVLYSLSIILLMYGLSLLPEFTAVWFTGTGILGFLIFVRREKQFKSPLFDIALFRYNRVFALSSLAALVIYSGSYGVNFILSLYLQLTKGLSPQDAGLVLVSQPLVMAVFSPFAGRLSDRIEPRVVASAGMASTAIGLFLFIFLTENSSLVFIITGLFLIGFGFALFSSPNTNAIMSSIEKRFYGVASGTVATVRLMGQMLSMSIIMVIFGLFIGRMQITPDLYQPFLKSAKSVFVIFTALCTGGIFASLARGNVRERAEQE